MSETFLCSGFQGWITTVFGSLWTYLILASLFTLLLGLMLVHFLRSKNPKNSSAEADALNTCDSSGACEEKLLQLIETLNGNSKTILLAAAGLECMPVTVPIRIAIKSSEKNKRCLLIDLDFKRNAVWKAFGLDRQNIPAASLPAPSGIKNLSVLPAHYFEQNKIMNIGPITKNAQKLYDLILINAPYLDGHPDRKMITSSSQYAFVFAKETPQVQRLQGLCHAGQCTVLGSYSIRKNGTPAPSGQ